MKLEKCACHITFVLCIKRYLEMALDLRYANSLHAHQLENSLRSCFCKTNEKGDQRLP
jgi:hypothetical protein